MKDADLIRGLHNGSQSAADELWNRYSQTVFRYAYARVGAQQDLCEEIVSETFLAAIRGIDGIDEEKGNLTSWLIGIARHKLYDTYRSNQRQSEFLEKLKSIADDELAYAKPEESLELAEQRTQIRQVLEKLSPVERQVLEWKYLDGKSVREIANWLDRTDKAVRSLIDRAKSSFRTASKQNQFSG